MKYNIYHISYHISRENAQFKIKNDDISMLEKKEKKKKIP